MRSAGTQPRPQRQATGRGAHAPDYLLLTSVIVLCVFGLIAVYSSSYALGTAQFKDANYFIKRQMVSLIIGSVAMAITMLTPFQLI